MSKMTIILAGCALFLSAFVNQVDIRKIHFNLDKKGLAIQGYDPVSYINSGKAVQGEATHSYTYQSVTYYFSSAANKATFISSPDKFEPAYGGWCAYAMGNTGEKVEIDPETFKVINGKTYLFYNFYFNNTLADWNKNQIKLMQSADRNWNKLTSTMK